MTRNAILSWVAVVAWAGLIFFFSSTSNLSISVGMWDFILRKGAHITEYVVLTLLVWNAVGRHVLSPGRSLTIAAAAAFLYACSDEFHQRFVPGRTGTPRDVAIDSVGIIVIVLFFIITRSKRRQRLDEPV